MSDIMKSALECDKMTKQKYVQSKESSTKMNGFVSEM